MDRLTLCAQKRLKRYMHSVLACHPHCPKYKLLTDAFQIQCPPPLRLLSPSLSPNPGGEEPPIRFPKLGKGAAEQPENGSASRPAEQGPGPGGRR